MAVVTLITDFGTVDGYVGAMKGVIATLAPEVTVVDVTHDIPAHDVAAAAFALAQSAPHFPPGTVHVVVVDPGVGGERAAVAFEHADARWVGPDNGVFALVAPVGTQAHLIERPAFRRESVASTFHGRDLFAPAAARLASGRRTRDAGRRVLLAGQLGDSPVRVSRDRRRILGHVIHVDRFGNAVTDIRAALLPAGAQVKAGELVVKRLAVTYEEVLRGRPVAYVGSSGTLEIAVREGSAARKYKLRRGSVVVVSA